MMMVMTIMMMAKKTHKENGNLGEYVSHTQCKANTPVSVRLSTTKRCITKCIGILILFKVSFQKYFFTYMSNIIMDPCNESCFSGSLAWQKLITRKLFNF